MHSLGQAPVGMVLRTWWPATVNHQREHTSSSLGLSGLLHSLVRRYVTLDWAVTASWLAQFSSVPELVLPQTSHWWWASVDQPGVGWVWTATARRCWERGWRCGGGGVARYCHSSSRSRPPSPHPGWPSGSPWESDMVTCFYLETAVADSSMVRLEVGRWQAPASKKSKTKQWGKYTQTGIDKKHNSKQGVCCCSCIVW